MAGCTVGPCRSANETYQESSLIKQDALGTLKVVGGRVSAFGGGSICTLGFGCVVGAPMVAIGLSEVRQGGTMLADAISGNSSNGDNPLRKYSVRTFGAKLGNALYDGTALITGVVGLARTVSVVMGVADNMNRPLSIFGATTTVWNKAKYVPLTNTLISIPFMQTSYELTNIYKASVVVRDLNNESK
ncbi:hypothetical protein ACO0K2_17410 [Undibacterium sp. MH2W]|uniref:hypothetical protein n=1 Tax=Undibacterium sp. MH2W TaxID=3413044 RepID=UPI003BF1DB00